MAAMTRAAAAAKRAGRVKTRVGLTGCKDREFAC
jgi:hypothetical protein